MIILGGCSTLPEQSQVRIIRDGYGTPHIYADSTYGLYYGYGYSIAQDRLFQMEMARRSTQGPLRKSWERTTSTTTRTRARYSIPRRFGASWLHLRRRIETYSEVMPPDSTPGWLKLEGHRTG